MNILFLCTGNSCRSQMAEGFARALAGPGVNIASAGIEAHGQNPRAVAVMAEIGIDIAAQASTILTDRALSGADLVVTVCGHADEHCPVLPAGTRRLHWPLPDPAKATGTEEEIHAEFRQVRDAIQQHVTELFEDKDDRSHS